MSLAPTRDLSASPLFNTNTTLFSWPEDFEGSPLPSLKCLEFWKHNPQSFAIKVMEAPEEMLEKDGKYKNNTNSSKSISA